MRGVGWGVSVSKSSVQDSKQEVAYILDAEIIRGGKNGSLL